MSRAKIFISHQQQDSNSAIAVQSHLKQKHNIECYLDVIDPNLKRGEEIAEHVRSELSRCTHLLAIVSDATKASWWVPWEIGVATEKDYPLATFGTNVVLPEYLMKWPYLKNYSDLDKYALTVSEVIITESFEKHGTLDSVTASASRSGTKQFYRSLRTKLGQ
ncbi:toll/interleukin-1 receptor domain-containing protein [Pseudomonas cichorii]|nr:toll/interleukin-1 receptor domain-containing protein [Pseudomonas cichorii]